MDIPWLLILYISLAGGAALYLFLLWLKWRQDKKWGKMKVNADWKRDIKRVSSVLLALALSSCGAVKVFNPDGTPLASINTDAKNVSLTRDASGSTVFTVESVTPSAVIASEGKAFVAPAALGLGMVGAMNATTQTVKAVKQPLLPR